MQLAPCVTWQPVGRIPSSVSLLLPFISSSGMGPLKAAWCCSLLALASSAAARSLFQEDVRPSQCSPSEGEWRPWEIKCDFSCGGSTWRLNCDCNIDSCNTLRCLVGPTLRPPAAGLSIMLGSRASAGHKMQIGRRKVPGDDIPFSCGVAAGVGLEEARIVSSSQHRCISRLRR